MSKKQKLFFVLLCIGIAGFSLFTLHKRTDYIEITETVYVSSVGIDYNLKDQEYIVYLYVLNNFNLGQSQYAAGQTETLAYIAKGKGPSLSKALWNIKMNSNTTLQLSHLRTMIVKDTFFQGNNARILYDYVQSTPDFFPSFDIYTTSEDLMDIYNVGIVSDTSVYYTILVNSEGLHKAKKVVFLNYMNDILKKEYTACYPILKLSKDTFYNDEKPTISLETVGYSFLTADYQLSSFQWEHIKGLLYFNQLDSTLLIFKDFDFLVNEYYYKTKYKQGKLHIHISMQGKFMNLSHSIDYNTLQNKIKESITNEILELKKIMDDYQIDAFNIAYLSHGKMNYLDCPLDIQIKLL